MTRETVCHDLSERTNGPWELAFYLAVPSKTKALELERDLKSGLGRAFLHRHIL